MRRSPRRVYSTHDDADARPRIRTPRQRLSHAHQLDSTAGRRLLARLRDVCALLPEVDEVVDGFGHTTFKVRKKSFVIAGMGEAGQDVAIKSDPATQDALVRHSARRDDSDAVWFRTPYIGHHGWVSIREPLDHDWAEIEDLVVDAYRLAAPKTLARRLDPRSAPRR